MVLEKDPGIGLEFVLNPESAHPTSVFVEAELEDGEIGVVGRAKADSKTKSTADIEVELRRDGETDYDDVHLDVVDNVTDSDELELEVEGSLRRIDMRRKESTSKTTTVRKKREVTNELDCVLTLEKDPLNDKKLDIDLEFTLNPESKKATTVELEVEVNANEMEIHGTADSLGEAIADIEVEFKRDDKIDHDDIHLEVTKNEHDSDDMELEIEAEKARKKRVLKKLPVKRKPSKPKPKPPVTKAKPKVPPSGPKKTTKPRSKSRSRSVSRKPSPRRTRSQSNNSKPKKPATKNLSKATSPKIANKNVRKPSRSPHKSKNFHPDKKKTIKSIEIEKNITKGKPDGKGKEAKTDVDTILYVEKHPISDKLDIDLDVVIDKSSKKPMTVNVEAQLDNEKATVAGKAKGKEKGKAMIDTEVHHSDYYEHHHDKARDRNIMDLNIEKKGKAAKDMELDARENTPIQVSNSEANKDHAKIYKKKPSRSESADSKGSKHSRSSSSKRKNTKVRTVSSDTDEEDPQSKKKTKKSQKKTKK